MIKYLFSNQLPNGNIWYIESSHKNFKLKSGYLNNVFSPKGHESRKLKVFDLETSITDAVNNTFTVKLASINDIKTVYIINNF